MSMKLAEYRLGDITSMSYGKMPPKSILCDAGYPVFTGYRIAGFANKFTHEEPMLLVVARGVGGTGDVKISPPKSWITNLSIVLDINPALADKKFLCELLNMAALKEKLDTGSAQSQITIGVLSAFRVHLPPLPIQQKIAAILSAYDDLIENNLKRIRLLEEMAQITYEEWFVRLRFPSHESMPVNPETGLPVGWGKFSLSQIGEYLNGYAFKPIDLGAEGMPIIKIKEIKAGVVNDTPRNTGKTIPEKYFVETGEILFSWSASLEVVVWQYERGLLNQHLFKVTPKKGISKAFLFLALKEALKVFDGLTTGATMKHIKRKELDFVQTAVPNDLIMQKFDVLVGAAIEEVLNLSKQNQHLRQARDILLPRLMTGMIDVESYDPAQLLKDAA